MRVWIPSKHQSAKQGEMQLPSPPQSELRKAANKVYGVKYQNGKLAKELHVVTEKFSFGLSEKLLEEARGTRHGKFLLDLLGCVNYANGQRRPVMLVGKKIKDHGGFRLVLVVPIDTSMKPGAVPIVGKHGDGVMRES